MVHRSPPTGPSRYRTPVLSDMLSNSTTHSQTLPEMLASDPGIHLFLLHLFDNATSLLCGLLPPFHYCLSFFTLSSPTCLYIFCLRPFSIFLSATNPSFSILPLFLCHPNILHLTSLLGGFCPQPHDQYDLPASIGQGLGHVAVAASTEQGKVFHGSCQGFLAAWWPPQ